MTKFTTLPGVWPAELQVWLQAQANAINAEHYPASYRASCLDQPHLHADKEYGFVFVRHFDAHMWALCATRPEVGEILFELGVEPLGDYGTRIYTWCSPGIHVTNEVIGQMLRAHFNLPPDDAGAPDQPIDPPFCYAQGGGSSCVHGWNHDEGKAHVSLQRCPNAWVALAMALVPNPRRFLNATAPDEDGQAPEPTVPPLSRAEWLAAAMESTPDLMKYAGLLRLVVPGADSTDAADDVCLSMEEWVDAARAVLPNPRVLPRLFQEWTRARVQQTAAPAPHKAPGAPIYDTNAWLDEVLPLLPDMWDCDHLYDEWMRGIIAETGVAPRDSRRSFKHAVERSIKRILKRRADGGTAPQAE